ncbi:hypothetical protein D3C79_658340 [compost metagenome]
MEALPVLVRQAIDEVEIGGAEPQCPGTLQHGADEVVVLLAVDRDLDRLVEVLHAEADAVEAQLPQHIQHVDRYLARIHLYADLALVREPEVFAQHGHQAAGLGFIQIGGRAAAPVQLGHQPVLEQRRLGLDLLLEEIEVLIGLVLVTGDHLVAAAVVTKLVAERDVHVERQIARRILLGGVNEVRITEALVELQRGGIGGVTRTAVVVFFDQGLVPHNLFCLHACFLFLLVITESTESPSVAPHP